jgi:hypothetical protein
MIDFKTAQEFLYDKVEEALGDYKNDWIKEFDGFIINPIIPQMEAALKLHKNFEKNEKFEEDFVIGFKNIHAAVYYLNNAIERNYYLRQDYAGTLNEGDGNDFYLTLTNRVTDEKETICFWLDINKMNGQALRFPKVDTVVNSYLKDAMDFNHKTVELIEKNGGLDDTFIDKYLKLNDGIMGWAFDDKILKCPLFYKEDIIKLKSMARNFFSDEN